MRIILLFMSFAVLLTLPFGVRAQNAAMWTQAFSGQGGQGIALNEAETKIAVWGGSIDSACLQTAPALLLIDTSGSSYVDTVFELNFCTDEMPRFFASDKSGPGFYLVTQNDVSTPQDSSYLYYIDENLTLQWSVYVGQNVRSEIQAYRNKNYISSDNFSQVRQVLTFNSQGVLDTLNAVSLPYFAWAPQKLICANGLVMEIGNQVNSDSAFVCLVYDTAGNYFTDFSFDANSLATEVPWYVGISSNQLFHVNSDFAAFTTYPACSGITGITNWVDTLPYRMHTYDGACVDTINDIGFVLCNSLNGDGIIFSYDLFTGTMMDSIIIDSLDALFTGIKSGPTGGVYLLYNKRFLNQIIVEQYDASLNLIWAGWANHPTCTNACDPIDFVIDSVGYVYTVTNCGTCPDPLLVSKYGPSLVGISEFTTTEPAFKIFPNPASSNVNIVSNESNKKLLTLTNVAGEILVSTTFYGSIYLLETSGYSDGLYFIDVMSDSGERSTQKLIIQH